MLRLGDSSLAITWGEDEYGDPFRIAVVSGEHLQTLESAVVQDVSPLQPWKAIVGTVLTSAQVHRYASSYRSGNWFTVPWGLELVFGSGRRLLVAAIRHGHVADGGITADEIVLLWSEKQIEKICRIHDSEAIEWRMK